MESLVPSSLSAHRHLTPNQTAGLASSSHRDCLVSTSEIIRQTDPLSPQRKVALPETIQLLLETSFSPSPSAYKSFLLHSSLELLSIRQDGRSPDS